MDITDMTPEVVARDEAIDNLRVLQLKGRSPLEALRVFGCEGGGLMAGFEDYVDDSVVLIADDMNRVYPNHRELFADLGGLLDAMEAAGDLPDDLLADERGTADGL